jgi:hypothetical protein
MMLKSNKYDIYIGECFFVEVGIRNQLFDIYIENTPTIVRA